MESDQPLRGYIFIVGVSRSGTTLMKNILNQSDSIAIARENHFMGHLIGSEGMRQKFRKVGDLAEDQNVVRLVDYIYSKDFNRGSIFRKASSHWRWIIRRVEPGVLKEKILASDRSDRAIFSIIMQLFADRKGKPIMGEKTPAHFRYVPTLVSWFPNARIIHMMRDPRGVYVSEVHRRQKENSSVPYRQLKHIPALMNLYILIQTTITWRESVRKGVRNQQHYSSNYRFQRFEDLVRDPEDQIRNLCQFLEVDFQEAMLDQVVVKHGFQENQTGFDSGAADRWKSLIGGWIDGWFRFWFKQDLDHFGYSTEATGQREMRNGNHHNGPSR
jgi:hypothetical protein